MKKKILNATAIPVKKSRILKPFFLSKTEEWEETKKLVFNAMKNLFDCEWFTPSKAYREVARQITDIKIWIVVTEEKNWFIYKKTVFRNTIPSENRIYDWIKDENDMFYYFNKKNNKPWSKLVKKQIEL